MVRQASIEVFKKIKENGLLPKCRLQVYEYLLQHGPCTANELFQKTWVSTRNVQSNFHARLGELRDQGAVYEVQLRACKTNGNTVAEYDVTNKLPVKFKRKKKQKCIFCRGSGFSE